MRTISNIILDYPIVQDAKRIFMKGNINMQKQKRITLNSEKRTAIANVFQSHFEREDSPVIKKYNEAKETYNNFRSQMKIFD